MIVASLLNPTLNGFLRQAVPDAEVVQVQAVDEAPAEARVLVAGPFAPASAVLPREKPAGWPFNIAWVHVVSVGIDAYPEWLFQGPTVTSAQGTSSVALAEFALAAMLTAAKRMPAIWIDAADQWRPSVIDMVLGQTLGIVGFGSLAEALAPRAQALGLEVLATRRSTAPIATAGVQRVADVAELFARSDHVVLAAPSTPQTHHIVSRDVLAGAKPGLHLINIARGSLIDDEALLAALDSGQVGLATLDVTEPEPLPAGHPYYQHPKVRLSAHTSAYTPATTANLARQFAENLARFRKGDALQGVVDLARGY